MMKKNEYLQKFVLKKAFSPKIAEYLGGGVAISVKRSWGKKLHFCQKGAKKNFTSKIRKKMQIS